MRGRIPLVPHRRRRIPPQFSWVDHRLVRDRHLQGRSAPALALYLFLVTVADLSACGHAQAGADGLSWYSDEALCRQLSCSAMHLERARAELQDAGLIAYRTPLYQVLDLSPVTVTLPACEPRLSASRTRQAGTDHGHDAEPVAIGTILHRMCGGVR